MSKMENPMLWWVPATVAVCQQTSDYFEKMQRAHENTPLAMNFAAGVSFYTQSAKALEAFSEAALIDTTPEYSVEVGGVIRPAAWN